jgi:hypothetical protein
MTPNNPKQNRVEDLWVTGKGIDPRVLSDIPQIFIYLYVYLHFQRDLYEKSSL